MLLVVRQSDLIKISFDKSYIIACKNLAAIYVAPLTFLDEFPAVTFTNISLLSLRHGISLSTLFHICTSSYADSMSTSLRPHM